MSILIPGMKMPKTCCGCKMMNYNPELIWNDNGKETVGAWVCLLTAELIDNTKREEHCPLIELPPHGDLIDRSKIAYTRDVCGFRTMDSAHRAQLENVIPVIPAEEE